LAGLERWPLTVHLTIITNRARAYWTAAAWLRTVDATRRRARV
jgi:hypothetical protein